MKVAAAASIILILTACQRLETKPLGNWILYHNLESSPETRIHFARFDKPNCEPCNKSNCELVIDKMNSEMKEMRISTRWWCEKEP